MAEPLVAYETKHKHVLEPERAAELQELLRAAHAYAVKFAVDVTFETPYGVYYARSDGKSWSVKMKDGK